MARTTGGEGVRAGRAVVVGGGPAGLLAAVVLADHFAEVVVVERDEFPGTAMARAGVPQGHHTHLLWPAGVAALEQVLPGIATALRASGARDVAMPAEMRWLGSHGFIQPDPAGGFQLLACTRPLLDWCIHRRAASCARIRFESSTVVTDLVVHAGFVAGIRARSRVSGAQRVIAAQAVVDASGRNSAAPSWLARAGYPPVAEESAALGVRYFSQVFRPRDERVARAGAVIRPRPGTPRFGAALPVEGGRWLVTVGDIMGLRRPREAAGFRELTGQLAVPLIHDLVADCEALSPVHAFAVGKARRRRYEQAARPIGFVAIGDALCSLSPMLGHGLTVAAQQSLALRDVLGEMGPQALRAQAQRSIARCVASPWRLTWSTASFPGSSRGSHTERVRAGTQRWLLDHLEAAAAADRGAADALARTVTLADTSVRRQTIALLAAAVRGQRSRLNQPPENDTNSRARANLPLPGPRPISWDRATPVRGDSMTGRKQIVR